MKKLKLTLIAGIIAGVSGAAQADILSAMKKLDGDKLSGNGSGSVNANCSDYSGQYDGATAILKSDQNGSGTTVSVEVEGARPNTHYTVWVRQKGSSHGAGFGGSSITGGGATPLAPSTALAELVDHWTDPAGSLTGSANSFHTDDDGIGEFNVALDFPMEGGSYPFNRMDHDTLLQAQAKRADATAKPTVIVDPREAGVNAGFLIRVVSHCQDDRSHGVSPATREPWFQYPL